MLAQPGLVCCARDRDVEVLNNEDDDVDAEACSSMLGVVDFIVFTANAIIDVLRRSSGH